MKIVKIVLILALPILLLVNIWRMFNMGDNYTYLGVSKTVDYVSTYQGFAITYSTWNGIGSSVGNMGSGDFTDFVQGLFMIVASPISIPVAIISDIIYNIGFFFGWIFSDFGNSQNPQFIRDSSSQIMPSWPV